MCYSTKTQTFHELNTAVTNQIPINLVNLTKFRCDKAWLATKHPLSTTTNN